MINIWHEIQCRNNSEYAITYYAFDFPDFQFSSLLINYEKQTKLNRLHHFSLFCHLNENSLRISVIVSIELMNSTTTRDHIGKLIQNSFREHSELLGNERYRHALHRSKDLALKIAYMRLVSWAFKEIACKLPWYLLGALVTTLNKAIKKMANNLAFISNWLNALNCLIVKCRTEYWYSF